MSKKGEEVRRETFHKDAVRGKGEHGGGKRGNVQSTRTHLPREIFIGKGEGLGEVKKEREGHEKVKKAGEGAVFFVTGCFRGTE